jgi:hypothetical protein
MATLFMYQIERNADYIQATIGRVPLRQIAWNLGVMVEDILIWLHRPGRSCWRISATLPEDFELFAVADFSLVD